MEMTKHSSISDYFVLMSAPSIIRVRSIADHLEEVLKNQGQPVRHKEGYRDGLWVLMDFGGVVVHVFHQDTSRFYEIENLWGDVPKKKYLHA